MIKMIKRDKGQRTKDKGQRAKDEGKKKEERRKKKADQAGRTGKVKQKAHTTYHQKLPHCVTTTPVTPRCHHFQLTPLTGGTGSSGRTESLPFTGTFSSEEPRQRPLTCIGAKAAARLPIPFWTSHGASLIALT
jgi:hypothetical protein